MGFAFRLGAGVMDLVMPIHLLEALATRGCCKEFAKKGKIQVLRDSKPYWHDEHINQPVMDTRQYQFGYCRI